MLKTEDDLIRAMHRMYDEAIKDAEVPQIAWSLLFSAAVAEMRSGGCTEDQCLVVMGSAIEGWTDALALRYKGKPELRVVYESEAT